MNAQTPVPDDHPLMIAWNAYKATDDYANTVKWASNVEWVKEPDNAAGQLWGAFVAGWRAGTGQ